VHLSCFTEWNLRLERAALNVEALALLCRRPREHTTLYWCSQKHWQSIKTTITQITHAWVETISHKAMLQRIRFITCGWDLAYPVQKFMGGQWDMCDGLAWRGTGRISKLNVTAASSLNKLEPSFLWFQGSLWTQNSVFSGRELLEILRKKINLCKYTATLRETLFTCQMNYCLTNIFYETILMFFFITWLFIVFHSILIILFLSLISQDFTLISHYVSKHWNYVNYFPFSIR